MTTETGNTPEKQELTLIEAKVFFFCDHFIWVLCLEVMLYRWTLS